MTEENCLAFGNAVGVTVAHGSHKGDVKMNGLTIDRTKVWKIARTSLRTTGAVVEVVITFLIVVFVIAVAGIVAVVTAREIITGSDPALRLTVHDGAGARFIGLMSLTVAEMFLFLGFRMLGKWWKSIPKTFAKWEVRPMRSWERIRTIWRTGVAVWKWVEDFLGGVLVTGAAGYAVVFALGDISSADAALLICGALFFYVGILALSGWWHSLRKTFSN